MSGNSKIFKIVNITTGAIIDKDFSSYAEAERFICFLVVISYNSKFLEHTDYFDIFIKQ